MNSISSGADEECPRKKFDDLPFPKDLLSHKFRFRRRRLKPQRPKFMNRKRSTRDNRCKLPSRPILNALTIETHVSTILADLNRPMGLAKNASIFEIQRLAPTCARIIRELENLIPEVPESVRPMLVEAHDQAWAMLEFDIDADERRAA